MNIAMVKRKCNVRGCREVQSFAISKTRETGMSVIICKNCLEEAIKSVKDFKMPEKPVFSGAVPELFYNRPAKKKPTEPVETAKADGSDSDSDKPGKKGRKKKK